MSVKFSVSKVTWVIVVLEVLIALGFIGFFKSCDKVYYERNMGFSDEARRNPFLAAEKFLKKVSVDFETRHDFSLFDDGIGEFDTIFINGSRIGMSKARRESMQQWVNKGGHLVLLATEFYEYEFNSSRDKFLDELGLRFYDSSDDYNDYSDEESLTQLKFDGFEDVTTARFHSYGYIEDTSGEASFVGGNEYADQFIQYQSGEGLVTILVDFSLWHNYRIEQNDHAMLLTQLIGSSPKAWLVYNRVQPSLLALLWRHAPLVFISALLILVLVLVGKLWRKGPAIQDQAPVQREIMQHIAAAGEFAYRGDQGHGLLQQNMQAINHRMSQLVHGYLRLTPTKQIEKLSSITGIPREELQLLWLEENENQDSFVEKVKLVQEIRKHL